MGHSWGFSTVHTPLELVIVRIEASSAKVAGRLLYVWSGESPRNRASGEVQAVRRFCLEAPDVIDCFCRLVLDCFWYASKIGDKAGKSC